MHTVHLLGADGALIARLEGAGLSLQWSLIHCVAAAAKAPDTAYVSRARNLEEAELVNDMMYHAYHDTPSLAAEAPGTAIAVPARKRHCLVYAPGPVSVDAGDATAREAVRASLVAALTAVRVFARGIRHVLLPVVNARPSVQAAAIAGAYTDLLTGARAPDCRHGGRGGGSVRGSVRVTVAIRPASVPLTAAESQRVLELLRF